ACRQSKRALGAVTLALCLIARRFGGDALPLSLTAVDLCECCENNCPQSYGERAADPISLPRGRSPPTRPDKVFVQVGRRVGVIIRPAVEPALGGLEVLAAQDRA